ncbi:DUF6850 family outer membrane beta-barrel protein [Gynurincola endophyticus]|uniref:DUF6850 family outer membrane beta-barrel protein n=1 Tax=Gynurincola endophyticus TaxID=2479004 RepID=UPI000F8CE3E6|nr:DUF6850 family outer membrane beta-barrel protein [Gynurincola endophyticus]
MKTLFYLVVLLLPAGAFAQPAAEWQKAQWRQNTVLFDNPVFLADNDSINIGNASLQYFSGNNKFRDAYMPEKSQGFKVQSEKFLSFNNWVIYGNFHFSKFEDFQTRMTSMNNPYSDNPYQVADSSYGDWRKQHYLLQAKIVSPKINRYTRAGIGLTYEVLNGARQKDPRPLDKTINIELTPSLMFDLHNHWKLGINGYYNRKREDLSISLENHLRNKEIFKLSGMGEYLYNGPIILGSLSRAYEGNIYGGGISVGYDFNQNKRLRSIISFKQNTENVTDGTSTPFNGGKHQYNDIEAQLVYSSVSTSKEHQLSVYLLNRNISNTEYVQVYNTTTQSYIVIHQSEMNSKIRTETNIRYQLLLTGKEKRVNWILGAGTNLRSSEELYPSTNGLEQLTTLQVSLESGKWIHFPKSQLLIKYNGSYQTALSSQLRYIHKSFSNNFAAYQITYPNFYFNSIDQLSNRLDVQYSFSVPKVLSQLYVKGSYTHFSNTRDNTYYKAGLANQFYSISIGVFN